MNEQRRWNLACLILCVGVAWPFQLSSQSTRPATVQHRNDCRLAGQVVSTGRPANKQDWAFAYLRSCGTEGGQVLATRLLEMRVATRRSADLERIVYTASQFEDRALFDAALHLAADRSAGNVARVQAIRVLHNQFSSGSIIPYEEFVGEFTSDDRLTGGSTIGTPLPAGFEIQIAQVLEVVAADGVSPSDVRRAALHVAAQARASRRVRLACPPVTSHHVCADSLNRGRNPEPPNGSIR